MPTTKKRISVYLTDEQFERVDRTARATGESRAATIVGLIEAAAPMLERVAELAEAIAAAPAEVRATFAGAAVKLEEQYGGMLDQAEAFWADLGAVLEEQRGDGEDDGSRLVIRDPES